MAGKIKLDGTQFLEKVNNEFKITNSELKLKSTGNTIVDSSGNAVVSESGGNVTLGNVRLPTTGGIKDSSGNNILTESGGTVTLNNGTIGSGVDFSGIANDSISGDKINGGTISGVTLGSDVNFGSIANDSISGDKINGGTATPATLSGSILSSTKLASSGTSLYKSNGSTAVISESGGTVTVDNVTIGTSTNFPPNILIDYKTQRSQGRYSSGNVYRTWGNMPSNLWMNITGLPTRKRIVVRYSIYATHDNHATIHCKYGWNSQGNVTTFVPSGYGSGGQSGINWSSDIPVKYPLAKIEYQLDPSTLMSTHMIFEFYDTNSSNTALYLTPVYLSENSTSSIFVNGDRANQTTHGSVIESWGEIYVYSY